MRRPRAVSREAIFAALFARLADVPGLVTRSRQFRGWNKVAAAEQPALFQVQGRQGGTTARGMPTKWTLEAELVVYVHKSTADAADPVIRLNMLVDAIEAALGPDPGDVACTLGGLVSSCTITGVETDQGALGDQSVAVVGLSLVVA